MTRKADAIAIIKYSTKSKKFRVQATIKQTHLSLMHGILKAFMAEIDETVHAMSEDPNTFGYLSKTIRQTKIHWYYSTRKAS